MSDGQNKARCHDELNAEKSAQGHTHGQIPQQTGEHAHGHICPQASLPEAADYEHLTHMACRSEQQKTDRITALAIRSYSGISGDIFLAGLATIVMRKNGIEPASTAGNELLAKTCAAIMPQLSKTVHIKHVLRNGIGGWLANVDLPCEHEHRTLKDIRDIIDASGISKSAKKLSLDCFALLASCEAGVHGSSPDEIHFHEVGALDSILDICATCQLFTMLGEPDIICSALPVADGTVRCAHGLVPAPAPAVLKLLCGVPVYPFGNSFAGELITPTGIALLHTLKAKFGAWPQFVLQTAEIIYGQKFFTNAANGVIFSLGETFAAAK